MWSPDSCLIFCRFRITLALLGEHTALLDESSTLAHLTPRRIYDSSIALCVIAYHACDAIQITLHPSPRSYFDGAQHERPGPSSTGYAKVSSRERA